jgi:hypothetical protein
VAERRKLTRFAVSAPVRLTLEGGGDSTEFESTARDLSAAGAYIYLDDPRLGVGDHVKVEIRLTVTNREDEDGAPLQIPMTGVGEIRRVDPSGLALAFDQMLRFA